MSGFDQSIYLFTFVALAALMLLEAVIPRRKLIGGVAWRWANNFSLAMLTWYINTAAVTYFMLFLARQAELHQLGLLSRWGVGSVWAFVILLVVLQLLNYVVHIASHKIPLLWRLHSVHHTDVEVDVSTSYRHHPLEPLIALPVYVPVILALGVPMEVALAYKLTEVTLTLLSHSNIRLPEKLDSVLRLIIVTPDYHRLHHCAEQRFTDSNYGSIVPWFDYLFGTASWRPYGEQQDMTLGLEYARQAEDSRLDRLLTAPLVESGR